MLCGRRGLDTFFVMVDDPHNKQFPEALLSQTSASLFLTDSNLTFHTAIRTRVPYRAVTVIVPYFSTFSIFISSLPDTNIPCFILFALEADYVPGSVCPQLTKREGKTFLFSPPPRKTKTSTEHLSHPSWCHLCSAPQSEGNQSKAK